MKAIMERHSSITAYFASMGTAVFGGLTLNEFALIMGILTSIGTFCVNWYYKRKEFKLREKSCAN